MPHAILFSLIASTALAARDQEPRPIPFAKLPARVANAVRKAAPAVKVGEVYEDSDGTTRGYLVAGTDVKGHRVTLELDSDGTIVEVVTTIRLDEVPPKTLAVAFRALVGHRCTGVRAVGTTTRKVDSYEFDGDFGDRLAGRSILSIQAP